MIFRYFSIYLIALALAGCATLGTTETVTVTVPVPTPCLAAADIPVRPAPTAIDLARATHRQRDAAQAADVAALDAYANLAEPLLKQCAQP